MRILDRARVAVPVYWMLVAAAHALAHQRRSLERERRALQAEAGLTEARLAALQAQLNPHFLFNTLNTIAHFVYADPAAAEETISALSELLRSALNAQQRREVALAEEVGFVKRYCEIQKARFADRLEVRFEISPDTLGAAVPSLLLLPLVENAIIHGARLAIEVADTGGAGGPAAGKAGVGLAFREGVGLANTRARLAALYGERHAFVLERAAEGGVSARIEIPLDPPTS
jgi:LytS/YehU family sensor histidine kinase